MRILAPSLKIKKSNKVNVSYRYDVVVSSNQLYRTNFREIQEQQKDGWFEIIDVAEWRYPVRGLKDPFPSSIAEPNLVCGNFLSHCLRNIYPGKELVSVLRRQKVSRACGFSIIDDFNYQRSPKNCNEELLRCPWPMGPIQSPVLTWLSQLHSLLVGVSLVAASYPHQFSMKAIQHTLACKEVDLQKLNWVLVWTTFGRACADESRSTGCPAPAQSRSVQAWEIQLIRQQMGSRYQRTPSQRDQQNIPCPKKISPCENPNSWWTGTVFRFDILWVTENMLCETKKAMWNTKHVICKHIPYFEKWPNVSWMEAWLRNLSEPNVSWMEPSLRNLSKPNVSWMEPSLRNLSEPNVSWMEPSLRNLSEPNVSWTEPSLRNLSEPNVSWMEPSLRNLSKPNISWMEPGLRNLSEPNVSWMEPSLRNLSEPNVSWMEPSLRNLSEPNVSWMEPSLRNLSEPNVSWMEPSLRNLSEPNVSWTEPSLRNLSEPNVSWMEPSLRNLSKPNISWMEPGLRNLSEPNVSWMEPSLRNLSEPNVSWMEPSLRNRFHSFGTSRNLVQGFGRLPQITPKLYWKNPKPFRLLGKNLCPSTFHFPLTKFRPQLFPQRAFFAWYSQLELLPGQGMIPELWSHPQGLKRIDQLVVEAIPAAQFPQLSQSLGERSERRPRQGFPNKNVRATVTPLRKSLTFDENCFYSILWTTGFCQCP